MTCPNDGEIMKAQCVDEVHGTVTYVCPVCGFTYVKRK